MEAEAERFFQSTSDDVDFYREASSAKNTKKSTATWLKIYNSWATCRGIGLREIDQIPPEELDNILQLFYVEVRKQDGQEYEPQCLKVMRAGIDRYLREKEYGVSIVKGEAFRKSQDVLEGVARQLRKKGKGKVPNRARSLSNDEVAILWDSGQLGGETPRSLIQTLWWNNCLHFGMRSREEHHNILVQDFEIQFDDAGRKFLTFQEGLTKCRNGGLNFKPRLIFPKMYATGGDRCPVRFFEKYIERRPPSLKNVGPFYLGVIDNPKEKTWYKTTPMGVHTINNLVKNMKEKTSLKDSSKKLTNHSARKTAVKILKSAKFPKCEIKNITGHSTINGLDPYDSGDDDDLREMSYAVHPDVISKFKANQHSAPTATPQGRIETL